MASSVKVEKMGASQRNYGDVVLTLENCLLSEEKLTPTPSGLDGLDPSLEAELRILGAELIQTAGKLLRLPQTAMATGQVLMHRFYYSKSYVKHPMEITAMACLCLASKIEEAPRRTRDIINVFHHIKQVRGKKTISPVILDPNYIHLKNQVIKAERRILKELGFCVHVQHPHKMIVMYLRFLRRENSTDLLQYACGCEEPADCGRLGLGSATLPRRPPAYAQRNAMNDALRTNVFVRYSPETVAAACIYLSARVKRVPLPNRPHWFTVFGMREQDLRDIATAIMKLYTRAKPNAEQLERAIEELRSRQQELRLKNKLLSGTNTPQGAGNFSPAPSHNNSPAEQRGGSVADSAGRDTPNGATAANAADEDSAVADGGDSAKLNKENIAAAPAKRSGDSSRSGSSSESGDRRKVKSSSKSRRDRYRSRSRSPSDVRRRHSSTPDRHRNKHKKDKERSRDKHRRRSAERARSRSPLRSKSKHDRSSHSSSVKRDRRVSPQPDRHKSSKKRSYDSNHKRR